MSIFLSMTHNNHPEQANEVSASKGPKTSWRVPPAKDRLVLGGGCCRRNTQSRCNPDQTNILYCDALCAPSWSLCTLCFKHRPGCDLGSLTNWHHLQATRSHFQLRCSAELRVPASLRFHCALMPSTNAEGATAPGDRRRGRRCCRRRCDRARRSSRSAAGNPTEDSHRTRSQGLRPQHSPSPRR